MSINRATFYFNKIDLISLTMFSTFIVLWNDMTQTNLKYRALVNDMIFQCIFARSNWNFDCGTCCFYSLWNLSENHPAEIIDFVYCWLFYFATSKELRATKIACITNDYLIIAIWLTIYLAIKKIDATIPYKLNIIESSKHFTFLNQPRRWSLRFLWTKYLSKKLAANFCFQ